MINMDAEKVKRTKIKLHMFIPYCDTTGNW